MEFARRKFCNDNQQVAVTTEFKLVPPPKCRLKPALATFRRHFHVDIDHLKLHVRNSCLLPCLGDAPICDCEDTPSQSHDKADYKIVRNEKRSGW